MPHEYKKYKPYIDLLQKWQSSINLVSKFDIDNIYNRHIQDSIVLSEYIKTKFNTSFKITDIGSGAGFPGMILAIENTNNIKLVESNHKKASFLNSIKNLYQLKNVEIINKRVEDLKNKTDIITSRAFKSIKETFDKTKNITDKNTNLILLKGKTVKIEINEAKNNYNFKYELIENKNSDGYIVHIKDVKYL